MIAFYPRIGPHEFFIRAGNGEQVQSSSALRYQTAADVVEGQLDAVTLDPRGSPS